MNPFLNKIKPKKLSTKILLGIVVLFSLYTVINKNYDKEIREPFRLAIHNDDGNLKNTYLIAHEFSKYLVDTPWDHTFYPIQLTKNTTSFMSIYILRWVYPFSMLYPKDDYGYFASKDTIQYKTIDTTSEYAHISLCISIQPYDITDINMVIDGFNQMLSIVDKVVLDTEDEYLLQIKNEGKDRTYNLLDQISKNKNKNHEMVLHNDLYGVRINYYSENKEIRLLMSIRNII